MATLFETAMRGYEIADDMIKETRGYQAAREQYGDGPASDPGLFSALQQMDLAKNTDARAERQTQIQERGADRADRQDTRQGEAHRTQQSTIEDTRKKEATLNLINGLREARDNGGDIGEAFDALADSLPGLGVAKEDLPAMREELLKNPEILDQYYEALSSPKDMTASERKAAEKRKLAAEKANAGREDVSRTIETMRAQYKLLDEQNAIVNPKEGPLANIGASIRGSFAGRIVEGAIGTQAESARRTIEGLRPSLINAMKGAEEMGARMFDSNKDMELWLATVTDPTQDMATVTRLLDEFEMKYGMAMDGETIDPITPPPDTQTGTGDYPRPDGTHEIYPGWTDPETGDKFVGTDLEDPTHWVDKNGKPYTAPAQ